MKTFFTIIALLGCCCGFAQNSKDYFEPLNDTPIYTATKTYHEDGYSYQCDLRYGELILYNKTDKLTYADIVYRETGKIFSCSLSEKRVIDSNSKMNRLTDEIVDNAFTKKMAAAFGRRDLLTITILLSPQTGKVMEVNFSFLITSKLTQVPLHVFREIETRMKNEVYYTPGELGKQLNAIMLAWNQIPKGAVPPITGKPDLPEEDGLDKPILQP